MQVEPGTSKTSKTEQNASPKIPRSSRSNSQLAKQDSLASLNSGLVNAKPKKRSIVQASEVL